MLSQQISEKEQYSKYFVKITYNIPENPILSPLLTVCSKNTSES